MAEIAVRDFSDESDKYLAEKSVIGRLWGLFGAGAGAGVGSSCCLPFSFQAVA